jgi:hypothetical protein
MLEDLNSDGMVTLIEWTKKRIVKRVYEARETGGTTKENMEGRVTRGDKKERTNMERGEKYSKG